LGAVPSPHPPPAGGGGDSRSSLLAHSQLLDLLDIGCGAGVAAEALARRGFNVLGLDAAGEAIEAARVHAAGHDLPLAYRTGTAEDLLAQRQRFPVITALEVIEHVPAPVAFLATLRDLLSPGGQLFLSTLNRTPRSFLAAKVAAEYVLRWLPVGTHDWRRFISPAELAAMLRHLGFRVTDVAGLAPDPLTGQWRVVRDTGVNYLLAACV
jgi:2-polyprenyl-6-hydroxyphenyl methylase/3-demethylubiquinone-9 3-methyltransferase